MADLLSIHLPRVAILVKQAYACKEGFEQQDKEVRQRI
jgi:hypothetical protein